MIEFLLYGLRGLGVLIAVLFAIGPLCFGEELADAATDQMESATTRFLAGAWLVVWGLLLFVTICALIGWFLFSGEVFHDRIK